MFTINFRECWQIPTIGGLDFYRPCVALTMYIGNTHVRTHTFTKLFFIYCFRFITVKLLSCLVGMCG